MGELVLKGSNNASPANANHILALLDHLWRDNVIVVKCRYFDLDALYTIPANKSDLSISLPLESGSAELKANNPLNLRPEIRILAIKDYVLDVKTPQREAGCVRSCVNTFNFFESYVALRSLLD